MGVIWCAKKTLPPTHNSKTYFFNSFVFNVLTYTGSNTDALLK